MLTFKEGETYICTEQYNNWFTVGKEYPVILNAVDNKLIIKDDDDNKWTDEEVRWSLQQFKLKEEPKFDLNKLTHEDLRIYCNLVDNLSDAQYSLDEFIKARTN